jgi:hypothetical protein
MIEWLDIILHLGKIGIPASDSHLFQIFAAVACDHIWLLGIKLFVKLLFQLPCMFLLLLIDLLRNILLLGLIRMVIHMQLGPSLSHSPTRLIMIQLSRIISLLRLLFVETPQVQSFSV